MRHLLLFLNPKRGTWRATDGDLVGSLLEISVSRMRMMRIGLQRRDKLGKRVFQFMHSRLDLGPVLLAGQMLEASRGAHGAGSAEICSEAFQAVGSVADSRRTAFGQSIYHLGQAAGPIFLQQADHFAKELVIVSHAAKRGFVVENGSHR